MRQTSQSKLLRDADLSNLRNGESAPSDHSNQVTVPIKLDWRFQSKKALVAEIEELGQELKIVAEIEEFGKSLKMVAELEDCGTDRLLKDSAVIRRGGEEESLEAVAQRDAKILELEKRLAKAEAEAVEWKNAAEASRKQTLQAWQALEAHSRALDVMRNDMQKAKGEVQTLHVELGKKTAALAKLQALQVAQIGSNKTSPSSICRLSPCCTPRAHVAEPNFSESVLSSFQTAQRQWESRQQDNTSEQGSASLPSTNTPADDIDLGQTSEGSEQEEMEKAKSCGPSQREGKLVFYTASPGSARHHKDIEGADASGVPQVSAAPLPPSAPTPASGVPLLASGTPLPAPGPPLRTTGTPFIASGMPLVVSGTPLAPVPESCDNVYAPAAMRVDCDIRKDTAKAEFETALQDILSAVDC